MTMMNGSCIISNRDNNLHQILKDMGDISKNIQKQKEIKGNIISNLKVKGVR